MAHEHHHHHAPQIEHLNKAFVLGIILNGAFVIVEAVFGFMTDSLALLSDAGHNLGDVFSLLLSLIAFKLMTVQPNKRYTYGYRKSSILISFLNACILLASVGIIIYESIQKLCHPVAMNGDTIAIVAAIGVLINAFSAWLFFKDKEKDLNIKGTYWHLAADALVSVGVVVSGLIMHYTQWYILDPIIGIMIALVILYSTWNLFSHSFRLTMDGVPSQIHIDEMKTELLNRFDYIRDIHHLHIWAISTTQVAMTAHIALNTMQNLPLHKHQIKDFLREYGINHATLEFESEEEVCEDSEAFPF